MIKRTKIGNTEIGIQATYHYPCHRILGIDFSRMEGMPNASRPLPTAYTFSINLWKYVALIKVIKGKK